VRVNQCVAGVGAVKAPVFFCLSSSCYAVTDVGGPRVCQPRAEGRHAE
jgi:hypothetical protein